MAAILHHRFSDKVVRLDRFAARRHGSAAGPLVRDWSIGPDGVLACRWTPASIVRRKPAREPGA